MAKTLADISEAMRDIDFCTLATHTADGATGARPMSNNRNVDYTGDSWFFTYDDRQMVADIGGDPHVGVTYQGSAGLGDLCAGFEDLLDPAPHPVDRLVPIFALLERLVVVATPHTGCDDARDTTLGADRIAKVATPAGAVSKHLTGIVRQGTGTRPAIIDIGRGNRNRFDPCGIGIGSDMRLEAVNGRFPFVFDPACITVLLTGGGNVSNGV